MKKLVTTLFLSSLAIMASAYDAEVNGLYYNLNQESKQASVTYKATDEDGYLNGDYTGDVIIPSEIVYNGNSFQVTAIGDSAFCNCEYLRSLVIPSSIVYIGADAFNNCWSLTSLDLPDGITYIGNGAFNSCSQLVINAIPSGLTTITRDCFSACQGFVDIVIPENVTEIQEWAFFSCMFMKSVKLPKNLKTVKQGAFQECPRMKSVYCYADEVPNAADDVFDKEMLQNMVLYVPETSVERYKAESPWKEFYSISPLGSEEPQLGYDFSAVSDDGKTIYYKIDGFSVSVVKGDSPYSGKIIIPETVSYNGVTYYVASIGNQAFMGCTEITSVEMPYTIISIGSNAFYGATNLITVKFPDYLSEMGNRCFYECFSLRSIELPNSLESIPDEAFKNCLCLKDITIGSNVKSIGKNAFCNIGVAENLGTRAADEALNVICIAESVPSTATDAFELTEIKDGTLIVKDNLVEVYKQASPWRDFGKIMGLTDASAINHIIYDDIPTDIYSLDGRKLSGLKPGINIISKDGKVRKTIVK